MQFKYANFINGVWQAGMGEGFYSINPATDEPVWSGKMASHYELRNAIYAAEAAFLKWKKKSFEERVVYVKTFSKLLEENKETIAVTISNEMGKPLWDSFQEVSATIKKTEISIKAYEERSSTKFQKLDSSQLHTSHAPHGVCAIFGPFNFPAHLPNGHIIPALLAGNTIILKPSELTPGVSDIIVQLWEKAGLPNGVINLVQGDRKVSTFLTEQEEVRGIFFTGSVTAGMAIQNISLSFPSRIIALEMGGNNPLIISNIEDLKAAVYLTIQSSFLTTGQRCSCARRLILIENENTDAFLDLLIETTKNIQIGHYSQNPEPYMGPLASKHAAKHVLSKCKELQNIGVPLLNMETLSYGSAFVTPAIFDVTDKIIADEEIFGPVLQVTRVSNLDDAILKANSTRFGLVSGIVTSSVNEYQEARDRLYAGCINWNTPLTGASSLAPFGGVGLSGNFRPSAFYAADYVAYPIASQESEVIKIPPTLPPGLEII